MDRMTLTLADFLLARIAEDEALARSLPYDAAGWWAFEMNRTAHTRHGDDLGPREWIVDSNPSLIAYGNSSREVQEYIARHDPVRVLAECEAKRWIVAEHADINADWRWDGDDDPLDAFCSTCEDRTRHDAAPWPCATLRMLALPYADHPDYRDEWRP